MSSLVKSYFAMELAVISSDVVSLNLKLLLIPVYYWMLIESREIN